MKKEEVTRKFDEIVDFSGVEKFIDTPVKRYSSGMYVRLAFAVAAHLDPEILIVDEVLAVGDAEFQKKCLGKMGDVSSKEGRTVLFVSHNMLAIENLCKNSIFLQNGSIAMIDSTNQAIKKYLSTTSYPDQRPNGIISSDRDGNLRILSLEFKDETSSQMGSVRCGQNIVVIFDVQAEKPIKNLIILLIFKDNYGNRTSVLNSYDAGFSFDLTKGKHEIICHIPHFSLTPGLFQIELKILSGNETMIWEKNLPSLNVNTGDFHGSGRLPNQKWGGICQLQQSWTIRES